MVVTIVPNNLCTSFRRAFNNPDNLKPLIRIWFRFILTNFHPRGEYLNVLSSRDKFLILCLLRSIKVNLSAIIFSHLKEFILASINSKKCYIPYGRVLSLLFELADVIRILCRAYFISGDVLFDGSCDAFEV